MLDLIKNPYFKLFRTSRRFLLILVWLSALPLVGYVFFKNHNLLSQTLPSCTSVISPNNPNPNNILSGVENSVNCIPVNCSSLSAGVANTVDDKKPGANCYYMGLRPCSKGFIGSPQPRVNCADLVDLPLCSVVTGQNAISTVNCVKESKDVFDPSTEASSTNVRGVDYAVNNVDSIRFCGQVEACDTANENCDNSAMNNTNNCTAIKCHQMDVSQTPDKNNNCTIVGCNLLTLDELKVSDSRFDDESKQYCDGSTAKCYNFFNNVNSNEQSSATNNSDNLQYLRSRTINPMCQIHQCPPSSSLCGADDSLNVASKGAAYVEDYIQYINGGMAVESGLCAPITCRPVANRQYRCVPLEDEDPTQLNQSCDNCLKCSDGENCPAADGCPAGSKAQQCSGGLCVKVIDCNLSSNNNQTECLISNPENVNNDGDLFDAWFFRPTPPSRVINSNGLVNGQGTLNSNTIYGKIKDDLCYSVDDMKNIPGLHHSYNTFIFGTYYAHYLGDPTRSPGLCSTSRFGFRGYGYSYLSGTNFNIFRNPDGNVGYIKGVAGANYELPYPEYRVTACLRYANSGQLSVHGKRECRIYFTDGPRSNPVTSQWCGTDVCKEMVIAQNDIDRCSFTEHNSLFSSSGPSCVSSNIDGDVRMRARKYRRKLCVFIDQKGAVAYNRKNYDGTEKLINGTCIEGQQDSDGNCNGFDTNKNKELADRWRTVRMIQYIGNNRPSGQAPGYIDIKDQFFPEQDCAKIPLRIGPPRFYNVGIISNSRNLFEPPLFILNARTIRGGPISEPSANQNLGITDFHQPEIVVQYGGVQQKMSLGTGFVGDDESPENFSSSPWHTNITTTVSGAQYNADIFIKKEFDSNLSQPIVCLWRNSVDSFGVPANPIKIACVQRAKPEIRNDINNNVRMKVDVRPDTNNAFNSARLKFDLVTDYGGNGKNDNCSGDDTCAQQVIFENLNVNNEQCSMAIEQYNFCSKRDDCSELVYECANNEIAFNNALAMGQATGEFESIKDNCNNNILKNCNSKFGIDDSGFPNFFSQIDQSKTANLNYQNFPSLFNSSTLAKVNPNLYGWFNEICISKGFEDKLKNVIAYKSVGGNLGKCQIDDLKSLYINDGIASTNCDAGGKAPYCVCAEAPDGMVLTTAELSSLEIRKETAREAGLCIDIPLPKFCPLQTYTNTSDYEQFTTSSINNSLVNSIFGPSYSNSNGVHTSHQSRTIANNFNHAEYKPIIEGSSNVAGTCSGFWQYQTNNNGAQIKPILNCLASGNWQKPANSQSCIRYSCPEISTFGLINGAPENNSYQNNYASGETGDNRGLANGFAVWAKKDKTNDFLETATAGSCIIGYKKVGSSFDGTNFSGGTAPSRSCQQDGHWLSNINNACQRIKCPALSVSGGTLPANNSSPADKATWLRYGGAEFSEGKASRSVQFIPSESRVTGTCNQNLGFFPASRPTTMDCDYLGRWTNLQNPCVTLGCSAISGNDGANASNGFANWPETVLTSQNSTLATASSCSTGYAPDPYAPNNAMPTRNCVSATPQDGTLSSIWDPNNPVKNPCINQCPGGSVNPTIGIGITAEATSVGIKNISWRSTNFGIYDYAEECTNMSATDFAGPKTNTCYRLRRLCGDGVKADFNGTVPKKGEWGMPEPMCVAGGGAINNAKFSDDLPSTSGNADSVVVGSPALTGVCVSGYAANPNINNAPKRKCVYADSNNFIDRVYFKLDSGSDCQRTCTIGANAIIGNSKHNSATAKTVFQGDVVNLICKDDTVGKVLGTSRPIINGESSICGASSYFSTTDRIPTLPTATCGANGSFTIANDCTACRTCPGNANVCPGNAGQSKIFGSLGCAIRSDNFSLRCHVAGGSDHHYAYINETTSPPSNVPAHGSYWRRCQFQNHNGGTSAILAAKCVDGRYFMKSRCLNDKSLGNNHNNYWGNCHDLRINQSGMASF